MTKNPEQILQDWEYQAGERDARDPTRAQIMEEAAILRAALATTERAVRAALEAAAGAKNHPSQVEGAFSSYWNGAHALRDAILAIRDDPAAVAKIIEGAQDA